MSQMANCRPSPCAVLVSSLLFSACSMVGSSRPNHPEGRKPIDKVRRLQRRLWKAAKQHPTRRFHALYDRICRRDVLQEAWRRVKRNKGVAGVDAVTLAAIEADGVERFLGSIEQELRGGRYRPKAVLRRYIPKADGNKRPLGIPTVRDRVVQAAAKLVLEPVFEADFKDSSHGFRPRRGTTGALETLRKLGARGYNHVLDADIRDYFGSIDHDKLMKLVARRISDRRVLRLIRLWRGFPFWPRVRRFDATSLTSAWLVPTCVIGCKLVSDFDSARATRSTAFS